AICPPSLHDALPICLASWLIGQRIELEEVRFAYPAPAHVGEYDLLFPGARRFAADATGLRFAAAYLDQPLLQDERELKGFLRQADRKSTRLNSSHVK